MLDSLATLGDLITRTDFLAGLLAGAVGVGVLFAVSRAQSGTQWWGGIFALAALVIINTVIGRRVGVSSGLFVLGAGGWLIRTDTDPKTRPFGWLLVLVGAFVIGWRGGLYDIDWLPFVAPIAVVIAGMALATWSRALPHNLLGPMMAITAFGIWVTVPETEHARVLLGVAIPLVVATLSPVGARLSTAGAFALGGILVWVVAVGGDARPASIVGGWASLGMMAIFPFTRTNATDLIEKRPVLVLGTHAGFVLIASRVIGLWESAVIASLAVLFVSVVAFLIVGWLAERSSAAFANRQGPE
ncbi:MAG TPA: hypothetical protein VGC03_09215 [Acidimicrobiia bacterium]|jgi:hypothetical protein